MKLYLVNLKDRRWEDCLYDAFDAHVVAAPSPYRARVLVSNAAADEGRAVWLDASKSTVTEIGVPKIEFGSEPRIILSSFNAG